VALCCFYRYPGQGEHRFNLHFNLVGIPGPTEATHDIQIYSSQKDVYVSIPFEMKENIIVYSLPGSQSMFLQKAVH
jgi:hypothetical protein